MQRKDLKLVIPSGNSKEILLVLLVSSIAGVSVSTGSSIQLSIGTRVLCQPTAIARYLLSDSTKDLSPKENLLNNVWIDWFLQCQTLSVADLTLIEESLSTPDQSLSKTSQLPDLLILSSLQSQMTWFQSIQSSYPKTTSFLKKHLKNPKFVSALSIGVSSTKTPVTAVNNQTVNVDSQVTISQLQHRVSKVLPIMGERNVLITSALPYVNNVPHLGNIIGCVLSADVFARYSRLRGYNTLFVCGTDEYGTTTETKALEENLSCQALCDKYHALHKQVYEWFGIDFDSFGRTTTEKQTQLAQDIYKKLALNGHVLEKTIEQLYCEKHQSFLADRLVEGTCPLCGYADARGDQCDGCGKLLNATELVHPHCKLDGSTPILRDSKHIFLNLTEQQPRLEEWVKKASTKGAWSSNSTTITQSWLTEGLKPRCITRDLKWGTPVPEPGYEDKVFYVWFDAPIGYLSITANYTSDWEKWWKNPENVQLYQFMGKDNVPFHTVIFPSTLLGTGEPWTLLHHISTTEYLQYENAKFSKSRGVGVFGNNVMDSGIPASVWRYYLLSNRPESSDAQFTWQAFVAANNNELLANLGNFVNRLIKFVNAKYDGIVPDYLIAQGAPEDKLKADVNALLKQYIESLEACKIKQGIKLVMEISALGNVFLQENKMDNSLFTDHKSRCAATVGTALNLVYLIGALVYPYMPSTSESIFRQLNAPLRRITEDWTSSDIRPGHCIGKAEYLFKRIDESRATELRQQYSGKQGNTASAPEPPKKSRSKAKKSSSPSTLIIADPPAKTIVRTPEIEALEKEVAVQGDVVRKLKTAQGSPEDIKKEVQKLLDLKARLGLLMK